MNDKDLQEIFLKIEYEVKLIQQGKNPPNKEMVKVVNSYIKNLIKECTKCDLPLFHGLYGHEKHCDGTPILKKYRNKNQKNSPRYCKECNVPIPKGKHHCENHQHQWDRPSFKELECNQCNVIKPKHHFNRRNNTCKICTNLAGLNGKEFKSTNVITQLLGEDAQKVFTRHKQYARKNRIQIKKLPQHIKKKKLLTKEVRELERKHEKELRYAKYLVKKKDNHIDRAKEGIEGRTKELDVMLNDLVDYIMKGLPMDDFNSKKDWNQSITQMETTMSKYLDVPLSIIRKKRQNKYRTDIMWTNYIDDKVKEIQPNYTGTAPWIMECLGKCGEKYEYPSRSALVRALGLGGLNDKKYAGYCDLCGHSQPRTEEMKQKARDSHIKILGFDSWEEYEENIFVMGNYKNYARVVRQLSHKNLKVYKPNEYKRFKSNTYNSTSGNYETGLTVEHIKPVSECWRKQIPIKMAAHSDNLKVITMRENNESWKRYIENSAQTNFTASKLTPLQKKT